jgi:hypothetical protein
MAIVASLVTVGLVLDRGPNAAATSAGDTQASRDPALSSWDDGAARTAILPFVDRVTRNGGPGFVPPPARIAVFDNDGTLWSEQPMLALLTDLRANGFKTFIVSGGGVARAATARGRRSASEVGRQRGRAKLFMTGNLSRARDLPRAVHSLTASGYQTPGIRRPGVKCYSSHQELPSSMLR